MILCLSIDPLRRQLEGLGEAGRAMLRLWRDGALIVVLATLILPGCAPLPKVEYWGGFFRHLHPPRYTFSSSQWLAAGDDVRLSIARLQSTSLPDAR
jgi:hypothetical protein